MGRRCAVISVILVLSQLSAACGGFSPSGQQPAAKTEAKPTEAAKPAASPAAASPAASPVAAASPASSPVAAASPVASPAASPAAAASPATQASAPLPPIRGTGEVIVNAYAAEYEDLFNRIIKEPFERETGIKVVYDSTGSAAEDYAKIRASQGDPGWDVVSVTAQEPIQGAKEGLLQEITEENVPSLRDLYPKVRQVVGNYGLAHEIQYMSLMYHKEKVQPAPDSWQVMWDPKVKGHALTFQFANILGVYHMLMAARINGGSMENVEPGFQALERLRDNLLDWPQQSTQAVVHMERGEVWVMPYWDGRANYYVDQGLPYDFVIPKEGSIPLINAMIVPKGAKNKENAYKFLEFWLRKEVQREWALGYTVGPGRGDIDFPDEFKKRHITSQAQLDQMQPPDFDYIARNRPAWTERINRIMAR
jgi:putative spermidine/putrescine transport system substrate-binding protein